MSFTWPRKNFTSFVPFSIIDRRHLDFSLNGNGTLNPSSLLTAFGPSGFLTASSRNRVVT